MYPYGLEIGADNVQVTCQPNTVFDGSTWTGQDGLTIVGKSTIQVTGCSFTKFQRHGVYVAGIHEESPASQIMLTRVSSTNNRGSGLHLDGNTKEIEVKQGTYSSNQQNGILLKANYVALGSGGEPTIPFPFPNTVTLDGNRVENNVQHGIHVDASEYYREAVYSEESILAILSNTIQYNHGDGVRNTGFSDYNHLSQGSYLVGNTIQSNKGSGVSLISSKSNYLHSHGIGTISASFDIIAKNIISSNDGDGISLTIPFPSGNNGQLLKLTSRVSHIFANYIRNNRNGIFIFSDSGALRTIQLLDASIKVYQNDISFNREKGIYLTSIGTRPPSSLDIILCNDILSNPQEGIRLENFDLSGISVAEMNIIEHNFLEGILIHNAGISNFLIFNNYIGSNLQTGVKLAGTSTQAFSFIDANDFDTNNPQAYSANPITWRNNWWSDYSPGCIDRLPRDGWCDFPYPIPINNQDIQPKAGAPSGWKQRGYLAQGTQIQVKPSCSVLQIPPRYERRPPRDIID